MSFFAGSTKPITFDEVLPVFDRERDIIRGVAPPEKTYMGIDWGLETTVLIMSDKGDILNAVKLNARDTGEGDEVEMIKKMIIDYNCVQVVADIGYGARQVKAITRRVWRACALLLLLFKADDSIRIQEA